MNGRTLSTSLALCVSLAADACDVEPDRSFDAESEWAAPSVTPPGPDSTEPFLLSQTGLYTDIVNKQLAPDLIEYEPAYALWSDAAEKLRFVRLPETTAIDTTDMDHWIFPVGSTLFKEFALEGRRLETRLVMRVGPNPEDYFMGAFVWNDDESDAVLMRDGQENIRNTDHDAPSMKQCEACHAGEPGRVLGLSAIQRVSLPEAAFSRAPAMRFEVPGDEQSAAALGYLHANCGHCHYAGGTAWPDTDLDLRLRVSDSASDEVAAYASAVATKMTDPSLKALRIAPGDPQSSGVWYRMSLRGPMKQMPPLATERVDDGGLRLVETWIRSL